MPPLSIHDPPARRGLILLALNEQFPLPMMEAALHARVAPVFLGDERAWSKDLAYLEQRGFVKRTEETVMGRKLVTFALTPDGINVAEGSVTDPGVEIASAG